MTTPFTYCITHKKTGKKYYGVRYKNDCHPNDLWDKYFTSSKTIKKLIKNEGLNAFEIEIRKVFSDKESAIVWEQKVLQRLKVTTNENWFNESISPGKIIWSNKTRRIHSNRMSGDKNPFFGKKHSEETKKKMSLSKKGKFGHKMSEETKKKLSLAKKGKPFSGYGGSDPEVRERARKTAIGQKRTEEQKNKMRLAALGRSWKKCPETGKRIFYRVPEF